MMRSLRALLLYALAGQTSRPDFGRPAPLPPTAIMIQCISLGGRGIWRIIRDDRRHVRMYKKDNRKRDGGLCHEIRYK